MGHSLILMHVSETRYIMQRAEKYGFSSVACFECETSWDEKSLLEVPIPFPGCKDDPQCSDT